MVDKQTQDAVDNLRDILNKLRVAMTPQEDGKTRLIYTVVLSADDAPKAGEALGEKLGGEWPDGVTVAGCWLEKLEAAQ